MNAQTIKKTVLATTIFTLLALAARAADVCLAWDAPPSTVTGYVLYASTNAFTATNFQTATLRVPLPPVASFQLSDVRPGTWWFTVTAQYGALESDCSNVLVAEVPRPPANLRTVAVQFSTTVTNWTDVGFFKIQVR